MSIKNKLQEYLRPARESQLLANWQCSAAIDAELTTHYKAVSKPANIALAAAVILLTGANLSAMSHKDMPRNTFLTLAGAAAVLGARSARQSRVLAPAVNVIASRENIFNASLALEAARQRLSAQQGALSGPLNPEIVLRTKVLDRTRNDFARQVEEFGPTQVPLAYRDTYQGIRNPNPICV